MSDLPKKGDTARVREHDVVLTDDAYVTGGPYRNRLVLPREDGWILVPADAVTVVKRAEDDRPFAVGTVLRSTLHSVASNSAVTGAPILTPRRCNYRGDLRGQVEGQILGPNTLGEFFVIAQTTYDAQTDTTTAHCRFATQADFEPTAATS